MGGMIFNEKKQDMQIISEYGDNFIYACSEEEKEC